MREKVWDYIQEQHMIAPGDRIVAGVSGGADSMALLHVLWALRERGGYELAAVHVNHGIRGGEALSDQIFVETYCRGQGIPCRSVFCDVRQLAADGRMGEEEAGRMARRDALEAFRAEWKGTKIALAHHRDDLAETVLHHLARGCGLRGLSGIQPVNGILIHPFLCIGREEIVHYLEENRIGWCTDSTNAADVYTRNRIRHHLLPWLAEEINPKAAEHIASAAFLAGEADGYLRGLGKEHLRENSSRAEGILLRASFFAAPHILQLYGLADAAEQLLGGMKDLTRQQMEGILRLARMPAGKEMPLCRGVYGIRRYDGVFLSRRGENTAEEQREDGVRLRIPGETRIGQDTFVCRLFPYDGQKIEEKKYTKWLDYDRISKNLVICRRRPGAYMTVTRDGGHKKIKAILINSKVPREDRERLWFIADGQEVLWAVGLRLGETGRITEETRTVLEIVYQGGTWNE